MQVVWHDHVCVDTQPLFPDAIPHAIHKDLGRFWIDKNWQPIDDGEGDKIDINSVYNFKSIDMLIIWCFCQDTGANRENLCSSIYIIYYNLSN